MTISTVHQPCNIFNLKFEQHVKGIVSFSNEQNCWTLWGSKLRVIKVGQDIHAYGKMLSICFMQ